MIKKTFFIILPIVIIIGLFSFLTSNENKDGHKHSDIDYWTCGMHPQVKRETSGKCPICVMDLVPVYKKVIATNEHKQHELNKDKDLGTVKATLLSEVKLGKRELLLAQVQTTKVSYRNISKTITTVGKIDYNEKTLAHVSAWIGGRVDKLYVNYTGEYVRKGQPLLKIYSPKLISTQTEYITLLKSKNTIKVSDIQKQLLSSVKQKLLLLGMTEGQLKLLEKTQKIETHTIIYSPITGTVIKKYAHEGMYFKVGQKLYDIANLNKVWVYADIYEHEMSFVRIGQTVRIDLPSHSLPLYGRVTFIDPILNPKTRTVKVRAEFKNYKNRLKPNMYVNASIKIATLGKVLSIPRLAVLSTGVRQIVYIETSPGIYVMRLIKLGELQGNFYPIKSGLKLGETVVTKGNFLIDSQSQLTGGSSLLNGVNSESKNSKMQIHNH